MPTLKEILADTANYADTEEITVKGVTVKLGDLRALENEQNIAKAAALEQRADALSQLEAQLTSQAESLAGYQAELEQLRGAQSGQKTFLEQLNDLTRQNKKTIFDEPGEYFSPLVDAIKEIRTQREALANDLKTLREQSEQVMKWHVRRQIEQEFDALPNKPKELKLADLVKHATVHKYVDDMQYPNLARAYQDVMAPAREKEREAQIRADERRKAAEERAKEPPANSYSNGAFVPMPGSRGAGAILSGKTSKKYGGVNKIPTEDILADPDIQALFSQG